MLDALPLSTTDQLHPDSEDAAVEGIGLAIAGLRRSRREAATRRVAVQLRKAEDVLDQAGIELAQTLIIALEARREAGIAATFGHDLVKDQMDVLASWAQSRGITVRFHRRALRYAGVLGTRIVAEGDTDRPENIA